MNLCSRVSLKAVIKTLDKRLKILFTIFLSNKILAHVLFTDTNKPFYFRT